MTNGYYLKSKSGDLRLLLRKIKKNSLNKEKQDPKALYSSE